MASAYFPRRMKTNPRPLCAIASDWFLAFSNCWSVISAGLGSVGAISIACLEYFSALLKTCGASGGLPCSERGYVVRRQLEFLFSVFQHLWNLSDLQVPECQRRIDRRFVTALRILLEKCFSQLNLLVCVRNRNIVECLIGGVFASADRRGGVERQRRDIRCFRLIARLGSRLALASLPAR